MFVYECVIGRVAGDYAGYKNSAELVVNTRIQEITHKNGGMFETTDHRLIPSAKRLTIDVAVWNRRKTGYIKWGQWKDALDNMVDYAPGWNRAKIHRLASHWDNWHLNDMTEECIHQTVVYETDDYGQQVPSFDKTADCPVTGYKYGTRYLVRELPEGIIASMQELFMTNRVPV